MKNKNYAALAAMVAAVVFVGKGISQSETARPIIHPTNPHEGFSPTAGSAAPQTPIITNHGGQVLGGQPDVYVIWYGNWNQQNGSDTSVGQSIVNYFLDNVSGSDYYKINTSYGASGTIWSHASAASTDRYSQGTRLSDAKVQAVVANAINTHALPLTANGLYFVLTSSDVAETSGFCSRYCGWHTHAMINGYDIKYAFVGNANRCLNACAAQTVSPNGNAGVDGMVSVIAHELEETNTDPDLNAWYDANGAENADKCAWTFGSSQTQLPSGAYYNMTLGPSTPPMNYLIQRNLSATDSECYVKYLGAQ